MFDNHETPEPRLGIVPPVVAIACAGGGLLLSFGLCGATSLMPQNRLAFLGMFGAWLFVLSLIVLFVAVFWLVIVLIINAFRS